jgi:serine/threonine protein kinase
MDMQYSEYCLADPLFFDIIDRLDDIRSRFAASDRPAPATWLRSGRSIWVEFRPPGVELPTQGWKVHVSGTPANAESILGIIWDFCVENGIAFKFIRSAELLSAWNSKYANRASSGKMAALYPANEAQLQTILTGLECLLRGYEGPYILSDLRWNSGPLYLRFGAFVERYCLSALGELMPAIEDPEGILVPDIRKPVFRIPAWVEIPSFLAEQVGDRLRRHDGADFPYQIKSALHFSNGGGVYLADDPRTGKRVVLKEARPLAGLDSHGMDALTRLRRERAILERLGHVDFAPNFIDFFTYWEHDFLVESFIEGECLQECVVRRHPLGTPEPGQSDFENYTEWALDILDQVEQALETIHRQGIVYGDLHWYNVIVKPNGKIVLIDFEIATDLSDASEPGLAAPGFVSSKVRSGRSVDLYALACLRLALFLPLTVLLDKDPTKATALVRGVEERFPVPRHFGQQILSVLGSDAGDAATASPGEFDTDSPDWDRIFASLVDGIAVSGTPDRADRLFPGDIEQFRDGGFTFAHGAAGVLYVLDTIGVDIDCGHKNWLAQAADNASNPHLGMYNGLHGTAHVLWKLGLRSEALTLVDRALELSDQVRTIDLYSGLSGIALNLLHFANVTGETLLRDIALQNADRLAQALKNSKSEIGTGVMWGFSGPALLFIHLFEQTGDDAFLDLAANALRRDLARCTMTADRTLQVEDMPRFIAYLGAGSAGIGLVMHRYLKHREDEEFLEKQAYIRRACQAEFSMEAGLFRGRAGFIAYLSQTGFSPQDPALKRHLRRLAWHAVPYRGHLAFPGAYLLRLSMDLATGSAGVLLALHTALKRPHIFLPFLDGPSAALSRKNEPEAVHQL